MFANQRLSGRLGSLLTCLPEGGALGAAPMVNRAPPGDGADAGAPNGDEACGVAAAPKLNTPGVVDGRLALFTAAGEEG